MSIKEINPDERERRKNRHNAETDSRSLTPLITVKSFYDDNDRKKVEEEDIGTAMLPPELSRSSEETLGKSQITKQNKLKQKPSQHSVVPTPIEMPFPLERVPSNNSLGLSHGVDNHKQKQLEL